VSYFNTRKPTHDELLYINEYIDLTPASEDWNPFDKSFASQEEAMMDTEGEIKQSKRQKTQRSLFAMKSNVNDIPDSGTIPVKESTTVLTTFPNMHETNLADFSKGLDLTISSLKSNDRKDTLDWKNLVQVFSCSPEVAKRTIEATARRCVRASKDPTLSRRYHTNDKMLRYPRLACDIFMDTFFSRVTSVRGFKVAQMLTSDFNYLHIGLMKTRSNLPQMLKYFFKSKGVSQQIIADGAKEQIKGETSRLCQLCSCTIVELEKDTPWSNHAELHIGLCKRGIMRELNEQMLP